LSSTGRVSSHIHPTDTQASRGEVTLEALTNSSKVMPMFFQFFSVKKILDALFDDSWCTLGLPEGEEALDLLLIELP
jgi:hypothetical protein